MQSTYTIDDFATQLRQLQVTALPSDPVNELLDHFRDSREVAMGRLVHIIDALTPDERRDVGRVGPSEIQRIAAQSGVDEQEVKRFFAGFRDLRQRLEIFAQMGTLERLRVAFGGRRSFLLAFPWLLVVVLLVARLAGW